MRTRLEFDNKCAACGAARRKEDLMYSKDELKPYCANINVCIAAHPNSYPNVLAAGGAITEMLGFKEASQEFNVQLMNNATEEQKQIIKLTQMPTTIRIDEYALAEHVIKYKEQYKHATLTEAIRDLVRDHMQVTQEGERRLAEEAKKNTAILPPDGEQLDIDNVKVETGTDKGVEVF